jgi:hypothetical protein
MKHRVIQGNEVLGVIKNNFENINEIYICSPYIKKDALQEIFEIFKSKKTLKVNIITKFDLLDIVLGSSDKEAFELIFEKTNYNNWTVKTFIVNNLHAKVVLLGLQTAILGSANITNSGLNRNKELGMAIYSGNSKIETIRDNLKEFIGFGYELTKEQFEFNSKNHLPKFEKKVVDIKQVLTAIKFERDAGLQSFPPSKNKENGIDYFNGVIEFLQYIKENKPTKDDCEKELTRRAKLNGEKNSETRLTFLFNLWLIYENEKGINLSNVGLQILENQSKIEFYNRLSGIFPEFEKLEEYLEKNKEVHPEDLELDKSLRGKADYWSIRLRWMESLGLAESVNRGHKKNYKKHN